jgi:hypothetical protein
MHIAAVDAVDYTFIKKFDQRRDQNLRARIGQVFLLPAAEVPIESAAIGAL